MSSPIDIWHSLLREVDAPALCSSLAERMRTRRLHFGGRPLCPFLRPFFLDAADEDRVRHAAETLWRLGEREALVASYREWGGTASPPLMAIVDWREVPTYSEFEIMRDAFTALGVPTVIADPRDLVFSNNRLYANGHAIDLVYRRVLINDMVARDRECRALVDAYEQRAVCVANSLRCKIPHKKAFFAVLTDERHANLFSADEREVIRRHIPWTVVVEERRVTRDGQAIDLLPHLRRHRDRFVIKPNDEYGGTRVTLGWGP